MAYATADDLFNRYDGRVITDLVQDVPGTRDTEAVAKADPKIAIALEDASGEIEAALQYGKRYEISELNSLTGSSRNYLVFLTCLLAMRNILGFKLGTHAQLKSEIDQQATQQIEQLRTGRNVFNLTEHIEAGLIDNVGTKGTQEVTLIKQRNQVGDRLTGRLFGWR